MTTLLSLYPRAWRDRYEDEFIALLEARPPDVHDRIDIVRGAIDARIHPPANVDGSLEPPVPVPYDGPWNLRLAGQVTLVGGFLYLATLWLAINGRLVQDGDTSYRDGSGGFLTLFLSIVCLLLGSWAVAATLPNTSRIARTATVVGAVAGLIWAASPWMLHLGVVLCLALVALAIEAARTRRWRWSDAALLVGGVTAAIGLAVVAITGTPFAVETLPIHAPDFQFVISLMLAPLWFATAHALLRPAIPIADRVVVRPPAA